MPSRFLVGWGGAAGATVACPPSSALLGALVLSAVAYGAYHSYTQPNVENFLTQYDPQLQSYQEMPLDWLHYLQNRSSHADPDPEADGPHTVIEVPGAEGKYTTFNGDGTFKQYRGSGKPHGNVSRPNLKETKNNPSPTGPRPGKPEVRAPRPDEIPNSK